MKDNRREALIQEVGDDIRLIQLVDDMVYLEGELERLRKLPKLKVNPKDPTKQKATPAARLYRECLGEYTNIVRLLERAKGYDNEVDTSPLREWLKKRTEG